MAKYYVNKNAQDTGEHEVHKSGCSHLPDSENRVYLGEFDVYQEAVHKAIDFFYNVEGCFLCLNDCHAW